MLITRNGFLKRSYFNPFIEIIYTVEDLLVWNSGCKDIGTGVLEFKDSRISFIPIEMNCVSDPFEFFFGKNCCVPNYMVW